jgi:hypothetical protein
VRALVAPRLQRLSEEHIVKIIFDPRSAESLDSVQSMMILSLWSPISGSAERRDGRLLIASAISMATSLRLQEASARVMELQEALTRGDRPVDNEELEQLMKNARLVSRCHSATLSFFDEYAVELSFKCRIIVGCFLC